MLFGMLETGDVCMMCTQLMSNISTHIVQCSVEPELSHVLCFRKKTLFVHVDSDTIDEGIFV